MSAQAGVHADNARRQFLELTHQSQALDPPSKHHFAAEINADKMEDGDEMLFCDAVAMG